MYRELSHDKTQETIDLLHKRIGERFPDASLYKVSAELRQITSETRSKIKWVSKPNWWIRISLCLLIGLSATLIFLSFQAFDYSVTSFKLVDLAQIMEAVVNDFILIGAAWFFLFTIESRIKRAKSLKALHELRAMAHVIDMHQLTKDPTEIGRKNRGTASSPERSMTAHELNRYLDYCGEMLSLLGKIAALYAQYFPDQTVLNTVDEIEGLTTGISRKCWQKIMLLHNKLD